MRVKQVALIILASVVIAGSSIAEQGNGNGRNRENPGRQTGRREMMHKKGGGHYQMGIDRLINNKEVRERLQLTDDQIARLKDIRDDLAEQRKEVMQEMREVREQQMKLMRADKLNKKEIMHKVNEFGKLRTKMERLRIRQLFAVNDVLTDEQLAQVKARMREKMNEAKKRREKWQKNGQGKRGANKGNCNMGADCPM